MVMTCPAVDGHWSAAPPSRKKEMIGKNAITNEGLMIDNRIQAEMSIKRLKGMLTTPGGDN